MQLTTRIPKPRRSRPAPPEEEAPVSREAAETRDARRGGGPEDRALYSCMCGYAFEAKVTTSVDCPHCGTEQAW
jgi:rubrerythrin